MCEHVLRGGIALGKPYNSRHTTVAMSDDLHLDELIYAETVVL